jgi:hypothetical protein
MADGEDQKSPKTITTIVSSTATTSDLLEYYAVQDALGIKRPFVIRQSERPPETHAIYSFVGQVASEWAHLEHTLDIIIWELATISQPDGACITAQLMGVAPRYRTLIAQLTHRSKTQPQFARFITKVNTLTGSSHDPQERRNRIVHDPWYVTFESGFGLLTRPLSEQISQFKSMPSKDLKFGIVEADLEQIKKTITDIKNLSAKAEVLKNEISDELEALKEKHS